MLFNPDGQLVNVPGSPGVTITSAADASGGTVAGATDFKPGVGPVGNGFDPYAGLDGNFYHSPCTDARTDFLAATFPVQPVSQFVFVNRCDGNAGRSASLRLSIRVGMAVPQIAALTAACVQTGTFTMFNAPVLPDAAAAGQINARMNRVRFVRVTQTTANSLHFRELFVFDDTWTNVARNKSCTMSSGSWDANTGCAKAFNHVIIHDDGGALLRPRPHSRRGGCGARVMMRERAR